MQITVTSTPELVLVNGRLTRVWIGETGKGVKVAAFIALIGVRNDLDADAYADFEADLAREHNPEVGHFDTGAL